MVEIQEKKNPSENEKNLREQNNIFCVGKQKTMHRMREREIDKFNYNKMVRIRKKIKEDKRI